ncbi:glycosyltransferase family 2 protein [Salinarimonas sp.]|uniref:glycosyltransferase family 2 protein n=1 Tax=Salinarimonas sp. TaxID=2766526 RepID=UPI00391D2673
MRIVVPMAGGDAAFVARGFPWAKPLIEIDGRPLVEHAYEPLRALGAAGPVFVIRKDDDLRFHLGDVLRLLAPDATVLHAAGETAGAACTVLLAIEHIDLQGELLIANADQVLDFDLGAAIASFRERGLDAGTIVFDSIHPRWSYVRLDADGLVVEAAEKRPISRSATAGVYWFARGADFVAAAQAMIRKGGAHRDGYFVCPAFNEMILAGRRIGVVEVARERYVSLATPQAVEDYVETLKERRRTRAA